jgi:hypothetical protein
MPITPLFKAMNLGEAILWLSIAAICLLMMFFRKGVRVDLFFAAIYFAAFGVSDLVERHTGAWYRPWWLLAWKGVCLVGFAVLLYRYVQRRKAAAKESGQAD